MRIRTEPFLWTMSANTLHNEGTHKSEEEEVRGWVGYLGECEVQSPGGGAHWMSPAISKFLQSCWRGRRRQRGKSGVRHSSRVCSAYRGGWQEVVSAGTA